MSLCLCPSVCVGRTPVVAAEAGRSNPGRTPVFAPPVAVSRAVLAASPRAELRPGSPDVVPAEGGPPCFFFGGGYCSPGKYVYVHAVAMYILLSVDNVLIQMNWREMAICLIQLI